MLTAAPLHTLPEADLGFVGHETYIIFRYIYEKENQITNTKVDTEVKIYFGPLQETWKGPVQVRGSVA
jgi:hypothetical protein